jgi:hypothetical protein
MPHKVGYTMSTRSHSMHIHTANAQSIGSLIFDGVHKPFPALACPLRRPEASGNSKKN